MGYRAGCGTKPAWTRVHLWPRRIQQADALLRERENSQYLPGVPFPDSVAVHAEAREALFVWHDDSCSSRERNAGNSLAYRPFVRLTRCSSARPKGWSLIQASGCPKLSASGALPTVEVLSGPNLAGEVAAGAPTTTVVASADIQLAKYAQQVLMCSTFRVYTNTDVIGVELGGALKNIIAISAGISDGLGFGDNTKAALVTRGLVEMTRLGIAMHACPQTFQGLSGIGDLMATCASNRSRNHQVGFRLAYGEQLVDIVGNTDQIAEGVPTTAPPLH